MLDEAGKVVNVLECAVDVTRQKELQRRTAEALELTRQFGEDNATSFVNGILDAAAKALEKGSLSAGEDSTN